MGVGVHRQEGIKGLLPARGETTDGEAWEGRKAGIPVESEEETDRGGRNRERDDREAEEERGQDIAVAPRHMSP